ncbi:hypothetical protein [Nocardioides panaciterrulae]|uniref:Uncharacterized protein n=1 Tax=Nocardioides panaciterrulae TaxID=661492 RepID=A0A7Y9E973_9ACTN|nr:hypothetical protein [Nocardioides panaciterrulae]NYD43485.1 hypothetical protein [Nocardioides panaciterrulae]
MLKFLLIVILLAIAVYLLVRVIQRRGLIGTDRPRDHTPPRPFGPDDDDEFLRELERRRRHPGDSDA